MRKNVDMTFIQNQLCMYTVSTLFLVNLWVKPTREDIFNKHLSQNWNLQCCLIEKIILRQWGNTRTNIVESIHMQTLTSEQSATQHND